MGDRPPELAAFGSAPAARREATTAVWPQLDAECSGVQSSCDTSRAGTGARGQGDVWRGWLEILCICDVSSEGAPLPGTHLVALIHGGASRRVREEQFDELGSA